MCWTDLIVRSMLRAQWGRMIELLESAIDVTFHGDVDIIFSVIPVKVEAAIEGAIPVDCEGVVILEDVDEMESVIFGNSFTKSRSGSCMFNTDPLEPNSAIELTLFINKQLSPSSYLSLSLFASKGTVQPA